MSSHHEVVIVGAGISGIAAAIKLREAGVTDVVILEKADTYGGTLTEAPETAEVPA